MYLVNLEFDPSKQRHIYDNKISDAFYDSLEGLLNDLRTVTLVSFGDRNAMTHLTEHVF